MASAGDRSTANERRIPTLADKYDLNRSPVFVSGVQAIVRLLLMQRERDRLAGLRTAAFVSGYRGSPLGGLDLQLGQLTKTLGENDIVFQPGLNEDLAATAVWGAQQAEMRGEGRFDGVFSIWYGKGPGVDRSGDVFRHANLAGTSRHGGVLALMGDDHTAESSTTAHQSEFRLVDVMMPILSPAGVQELIDFGLYGWAMSRYAGVWTGLKCVKDTVESTASIDGSLDRVTIALSTDYELPMGGLNIRPRDPVLEQEARLQDHKRDAMLAFLRANPLNRIITSGGPNPKIGLITTGKSYLDVRQAMDDLGIDEVRANALGLRLYKIGCVWPIEPRGLLDFARGLDLIIVVEEKRSLIEVQVREELYGTSHQPRCIGKKDEAGHWLFPVKGALDANDIAIAIGDRLLSYNEDSALRARLERLREAQKILADTKDVGSRTPYFCSGCPHNSSTIVPDGMRAYAGIGCHYMAQSMDRATDGFTQMGGEGANWVGEAPFSTRRHVFQNLGDGTYNHSGSLAVRWAVDSGVNITYKILFNDAVAMTGGQRHEGGLSVPMIARQMAAEGAKKVVVVTDEPEKYAPGEAWPSGLTIHHRDDLDSVQRDLAAIDGASVLIYDQTCAAEKRRRRKRGTFPDPDKRVIINELVCEGCGDCGVQSNCVSVQPLETAFGRKRTIDQSSCNKDFSCVKGFCPSFVTVEGVKPRKAKPSVAASLAAALPDPTIPVLDAGSYGILITGIGGTGVVTIGAILGMAAHIEGKGCGIIDMAGMAQKGGAVMSHVKLANRAEDVHAIRVAAGAADLVLGCDLVVTGTKKVLASVRRNVTGVLVNTSEIYPGDFTRDADFTLPVERIKRAVRQAAGESARFLDATGIATHILGNAIAANMIMLGHAYQSGLVPLAAASIQKAIELNGEAVAMNLAAFDWGRRAAIDPPAIPASSPAIPDTLDAIVERRVRFLTAYQNAAYAERYARFVARVRAVEAPGQTGFSIAVARNLFKLMAIKDEYEVARLYTDGSFSAQLRATFDGAAKLTFHLAPPLLARTDPRTGRPRKLAFGSWIMPVFKGLAAMKGLRGTVFDVFGYTAERRTERRLVGDYETLVGQLLDHLAPDTYALCVALAAIPEKIRGYGPVKMQHLQSAKAEEAALLARLHAGQPTLQAAAE